MDTKKLLSKLTLDQKLAQMSQFNLVLLRPDADGGVTGPAQKMELTREIIDSVGSTLNVKDAASTIEAQKEHLEHDPNKIPLLFMHDIIHGCHTIYPIPLGMGATFDPALMEECCSMAAKEASAMGINVTFGPMVDLARDCRWGRCMETTGEDPYLNCLMSAAQVRGFQGNLDKEHVAACVKHYACYGGAEAGRDYNTVDMSEHTLREYYLPAYKAAVDAGVEMLMTSFNLLNGVPSSGNKYLVKDILRDEWGFNGVVISDYNAFREMEKHGYCADGKECAEKALNATSDIEMMSNCYIKYLKELVAEGKVSEKQIDEAVLRILDLKDKLGLFKDPYRGASEKKCKKLFLSRPHRALCRTAAAKSAVLLKNDGVLPLGGEEKTIALIGPFAKKGMIGAWSAYGKEDEAVSVFDGIKKAAAKGTRLSYAQGCDGAIRAETDESEISKAVRLAKRSEAVILCLGEDRAQSGEGCSRANVALPAPQLELLRKVCAVNEKVVCVIFNGRPLDLSAVVEVCPAVFTMWQPGTEGGNAAADLIFGKADFEGKLPMSFPRFVGQAPIYYNRNNTGRPAGDNMDAAYSSRYQDCPTSPLFPFGFGLSYTSFAYSPVTLSKSEMSENDTVVASVTVTNTGKRQGTETVQLYIRDRFASLVRPVRELKGFEKITLEPGESKTVNFDISASTLAFYGASGEFKAEKGEFLIYATSDSQSGEPVSLWLK